MQGEITEYKKELPLLVQKKVHTFSRQRLLYPFDNFMLENSNPTFGSRVCPLIFASELHENHPFMGP